ncbi:hypothetical protein HOO65_030350 [Ceratocystis lukuohia]|uniref:Uncharacterized protein n=1 Tax=Ceratocystis lukuohia TaxID=2019550 RepID=A0ABR4MKT7_9PEZI
MSAQVVTSDIPSASSIVDLARPSTLRNMSSFTRTPAPLPQSDKGFFNPSSPSRAMSSSPRLSSPARSQIFERDVQDSVFTVPCSPAIPGHIQTENHIPSVLDASSEAITDRDLNPDSVEIVTHNSHQTAAFSVATNIPHSPIAQSSDFLSTFGADDLASLSEKDHDDYVPNDELPDTADVRRLSFISFADVVQGEQLGAPVIGSSRSSVHMAGLTSLSSLNQPVSPFRSASPILSSVSSQVTSRRSLNKFDLSTSPEGPLRSPDMSPSRKSVTSPIAMHHSANFGPAGSEVTVETMAQALRRTASSDLSGNIRSYPTSPI